MSEIYHDEPMRPLQKAVYWVEYIARHRGAPHLHSAAQDLSVITLYNVDVYTFFVFSALLILAILRNIIQRLFSSIKFGAVKVKRS